MRDGRKNVAAPVNACDQPAWNERLLSRREREILSVVVVLGCATARQVQARLNDTSNYSTVRTILRHLERKGFLRHSKAKICYVYEPIVTAEQALNEAVREFVNTFFDGLSRDVIIHLIKSSDLNDWELDQITTVVGNKRLSLKRASDCE